MAYRRIIQMSPTTKVVSLPTSWLSKNNIKKGDYVNIEESHNKIIIDKLKSDNELIISDLRGLNEDLLWTTIDSYYILGYSRMQLRVDETQKKLLSTIVRYFPMFVIASETKTIVELNAVANTLEMDFDKTLQHIRHMTNNMVDEGLNHISKKNWDALIKIKKIDYTLNTYISMCFRELNTGNKVNVVAWSQYVKLLELYADRLCVFFETIAKSKKVSKTDIDLIKRTKSLYDGSFKLLNDFTLAKANEYDSSRKLLDKLFSKSDLGVNFHELTRILYDMNEIVFQLKKLE